MKPSPTQHKTRDGRKVPRPNWHGYIVPAKEFAALLEVEIEKAHTLVEQDGEGDQVEKGGLSYIVRRASAISRGRHTEQAIYRRLYDVRAGNSQALQVDMAECVLLACGISLDHDTNIPTLPGCEASAREMVAIRRPGLGVKGVAQKARVLLDYRDRILYPDGYPGPSPESQKRWLKRRERHSAVQRATSKLAA